MSGGLSQVQARAMIEELGGKGTPPQFGLRYFTAGLDPYLSVIDDEYLRTYVAEGGSAFKMVIGMYGGGKTHFLYCVRDRAWDQKFVISYVGLKQDETPFARLDLVYAAIVRGLEAPPDSEDEVRSGSEKGIANLLRGWYAQKFQVYAGEGLHPQVAKETLVQELDAIQGIESISLAKAVRGALQALANGRSEEFDAICQWLGAEGYDASVHRKFGILQKIDKTTAPMMLRSLAQIVRALGYSGLIILLDELEQRPSMSGSQREHLLGNLRELIDECGHTNFKSTMVFYAVPDEQFLEGRTQTYEALRQRLATVFEDLNPTGVKIELEKVIPEPVPFLREVGQKLVTVYEVAYQPLDASLHPKLIDLVAEDSAEKRWGDVGYKRLFVQQLVKGFHFLRRRGTVPSLDDLA